MNSVNKQNLVDKSSNSVWFLIWGVASVTLFIKIDFYDPFNSAKLLFLLFVSGWISGHLISSYKEMPIVFKSREFIGFSIVTSFILFLAISTLITRPFIVGLIGDTQRRNGFLAYLSLSIILMYASRSITKYNVLRVYKIGILSGLIISAYGLIQINGKDFIAWNNPYNAMISTLGNPNFASAMLAILSLMAFCGLMINNLNKTYKFISLVVIIFAMIAILGSDSRQGLLTIFFGLIFYLSIYTYLRNKKYGIPVIIFSAFSAILATLGMLQKGPLEELLYKDSVSVRGFYWRAGIEMLKAFPFSGVGVDRYGSYFKEFREVGYPLKYGFDITSSNAHNTIIQLFATSGALVGISYLFLVGFIFIVGVRSLSQGNLEDKKILLGLISAWLGFQAQSLISIDNIGISVWGWLLGGAILGLTRQAEIDVVLTNKNYKKSNSNTVKLNLFQPAVSTIILIPIVIFTSQFYRSETNLNLVKNFAVPSEQQNRQFVIERSSEILNNKFTDPNYKYLTALYLSQIGESEKVYAIILGLHESDPKNLDYLKGLANLEHSQNNVPSEISFRKQIVNGDPWNAENYLQLLELYKSSGDIENAVSMKNKILSFAPNSDAAKQAIVLLG